MAAVVSVLLENFPLSDLLAETSTGLEASMSNSTSCRYSPELARSPIDSGPTFFSGQVQK